MTENETHSEANHSLAPLQEPTVLVPYPPEEGRREDGSHDGSRRRSIAGSAGGRLAMLALLVLGVVLVNLAVTPAEGSPDGGSALARIVRSLAQWGSEEETSPRAAGPISGASEVMASAPSAPTAGVVPDGEPRMTAPAGAPGSTIPAGPASLSPPSSATPLPSGAGPSPADTDATAASGTLVLNSYPWGTVYLNGEWLGNTPILGHRLPPGIHQLRIVRDGYRPHIEMVRVEAASELRNTSIVLAPEAP